MVKTEPVLLLIIKVYILEGALSSISVFYVKNYYDQKWDTLYYYKSKHLQIIVPKTPDVFKGK